jgi:hypothetical protein
MIRKLFFVPLASSLLSLACAQAIAAPSPYSHFVVFGDSLSSSGQFADPGGPAGASFRATNRTGPVYLDGRGEAYSAVAPQILGAKLGFSDDQLAGSTSAARASEGLPDGDNWAVGGYRTDQAVDALKHGTSLVIAPEGTRSPTPRLARFKKGAFHIAMQAGVPIVPVVLRNTGDALPKSGFVVRPTTIEVVVLPPIDTSGWTRERLDIEIEAIRSRYLEVLEG